MLLVEPFFKGFTQLPISDAKQATEALIALSCDSRVEVNDLVGRAVAAGGTTPNEPKDMGSCFNMASPT